MPISLNEAGPQLNVGELAAAMQCMPIGVTIIDRSLTVRFWNDAVCRFLDLPGEVMRPGVSLRELFEFNARRGDYGPGDPEQQVRQRLELAQQFQPHRFMRTRADGSILDIAGSVIYDEHGAMTGFVTIYQDVTVEKRHEQQLEETNKKLLMAYDDLKLAQIGYAAMEEDRRKYYQMAVRDPVTDLFTRYYMEDAAGRLIELHERNASAKLGLLIFDIDHFKTINDSYGHLSGDAVLKRVGVLLAQQSRRIDVAVRFGGDEFAVFLSGVGGDECMAFAERIRLGIAALRFDDTLSALTLTISIGVAEHRVGELLPDLIMRADAALYEAKRAGRNRVHGSQ